MATSIQQIELVSGIFGLIDAQHPGIKASTRQCNAVIRAVDLIIEAFAQDDVEAGDNIGLESWFQTDSVSASSRYMALYLTDGDAQENGPHPRDPADFCRCRILLKAVPELVVKLPNIANASPFWASLVANWDEISCLIDEEAPNWRSQEGSSPKAYALMKSLGC